MWLQYLLNIPRYIIDMAFPIQFFIYEHSQKFCTGDFVNQMTFKIETDVWDWPFLGWYDHMMRIFNIEGQFIDLKPSRNCL